MLTAKLPLTGSQFRLITLRWGLLLLLLCGSLAAPAQVKTLTEEARRANLETQLTAMEQAFLQDDFETFADFMHPDVVRLAGGADVLAKQLRKGMEEMVAQGGKVSKVSHGAASRMVTSGREWQCTVPQTIEFQLANESRATESTLLAVSADGGQHWTFLDTAGKDAETVRRLVPNLSREIVLPRQK